MVARAIPPATNGFPADSHVMANARTPEEVAEIIVRGIEAERFLILTDPADAQVPADKAADYDAWLGTKLKSFEGLAGTQA